MKLPVKTLEARKRAINNLVEIADNLARWVPDDDNVLVGLRRFVANATIVVMNGEEPGDDESGAA